MSILRTASDRPYVSAPSVKAIAYQVELELELFA